MPYTTTITDFLDTQILEIIEGHIASAISTLKDGLSVQIMQKKTDGGYSITRLPRSLLSLESMHQKEIAKYLNQIQKQNQCLFPHGKRAKFDAIDYKDGFILIK